MLQGDAYDQIAEIVKKIRSEEIRLANPNSPANLGHFISLVHDLIECVRRHYSESDLFNGMDKCPYYHPLVYLAKCLVDEWTDRGVL